ncbi:hypothetical protein M3697_12455 [Janibacter melonis]|uniref:hypothetical protein n=1 Tax=Janibacter melonis TaxID=262209 RepID=UPI00204351D5|nr:hypothetical protein [Janibacter melonis]MCM3555908.1 hypothetical protein [Janibacter melonis]
MTMTAVIGGKTAPGVTTVALAASWAAGRPVTVVDADPLGGDVLPGMLPGRTDNSGGLLQWIVATRRGSAQQAAERLPAFGVQASADHPVTVIAGIQSPSQAATLTGSWDRVATALTHHEGDIVVDLGRAHDQSGWALVSGADRVLLVVRPTARAVHAAGWALAQLQQRLGDLDRVRLVVNGPGPYSPGEVGEVLGFGSCVHVPSDRKAAAMLTDGAPFAERALLRSRLVRACSELLPARQEARA